MPHKLLPTLDYTRHARWLLRSTGSEHALAVCDAAGAPLWSAAGHADLAPWLARLSDEGVAHLVVGKNLGADSLTSWLCEQGFDAARVASAKGFRIIDVHA